MWGCQRAVALALVVVSAAQASSFGEPPAALERRLQPGVSAQRLPICPQRDVVPAFLQGFGFIRGMQDNAELNGNYSIHPNGVEHYGPDLFNGGKDVPAGVLSTICASSGSFEGNGTYALTFAREEVDPLASYCGIIAYEAAGTDVYTLHVDYWPQVRAWRALAHVSVTSERRCAIAARLRRRCRLRRRSRALSGDAATHVGSTSPAPPTPGGGPPSVPRHQVP